MRFGMIVAAVLIAFAGTASADPVGGPKRASGVLMPGGVVSYTIALRANELTIFSVIGDGDGDIDCSAIDENGNIVAIDTSAEDKCTLRIAPRWTGPFNFVLINNGDIASRYVARAF